MDMKTFVSTFLLSLVFSLSAFGQNVQGVFMVVKGDVKLTAGAKTDPAKVGTKVGPGDTITSGPDSRAKIVMADKNVINISPDSKITIEKYENDGKEKKSVELKVEYGKLRASVEQKYDGEKSKFNIKTPTAVAGVRGTDFLTGFNAANRTTQVVTFSGTVAFGTPGPGGTIQNAVFVQPGQMTTSVGGKPPEKPVAMPKDQLNKMNNESDGSAKNQGPGGDRQPASEGGDKKSDGGGKGELLPPPPPGGPDKPGCPGGICPLPDRPKPPGGCPPICVPPPPPTSGKSKVNIIINRQ